MRMTEEEKEDEDVNEERGGKAGVEVGKSGCGKQRRMQRRMEVMRRKK